MLVLLPWSLLSLRTGIVLQLLHCTHTHTYIYIYVNVVQVHIYVCVNLCCIVTEGVLKTDFRLTPVIIMHFLGGLPLWGFTAVCLKTVYVEALITWYS